MRRLGPIGIALSLAGAATSTSPSALAEDGALISGDTQSTTIIGGKKADVSQYRYAVRLSASGGVCTAAKVDHLAFVTAAHCVTNKDGSRSSAYGKGKSLTVRGYSGAGSGYQDYALTIKKTYVDTTYAKAAAADAGRRDDKLPKGTYVDLALVLVNEMTPLLSRLAVPSLLSAPISPSSGETVRLLGYGCTSADGGVQSSLFTGTAKVTALDDGEFKTPRSTGAAICPGDSGGPVTMQFMDAPLLVGVNSGHNDSYSVFSWVSPMHGRSITMCAGIRSKNLMGKVFEPEEIFDEKTRCGAFTY